MFEAFCSSTARLHLVARSLGGTRAVVVEDSKASIAGYQVDIGGPIWVGPVADDRGPDVPWKAAVG